MAGSARESVALYSSYLHLFGQLETTPPLYSEKYQTVMSQTQRGSRTVQHMPDYLSGGAWLSTKNAPGILQRIPTPKLHLGEGIDRKGTKRSKRNRGMKRRRKRKSGKRKGRNGNQKNKAPYRHFYFPTSSPSRTATRTGRTEINTLLGDPLACRVQGNYGRPL